MVVDLRLLAENAGLDESLFIMEPLADSLFHFAANSDQSYFY